jgi:small-conductance mechanosensitive channel
MSDTLAAAHVDVGGAITDMLRSVLLFLPKALGFIVILVVGWLVARLARTVVDKVLERVGFDRAVERGGIARALARSRYDASDLVARLVYYAVLLFTLQLAFGIWGANPVSDLIKGVVAWLPKARWADCRTGGCWRMSRRCSSSAWV